jgi:ABC-2 type transport system ATP-binding protein
MPALEVVELRKRFGSLPAVDGVSFEVGLGRILGLLGPNGAGKTTIVSMITGLLRPDSGAVLVEGKPLKGDNDPVKRSIGVVPQDLALFDEFSAEENLTLFGELYGLHGKPLQHAMKQALELVGLSDRAKDRVRVYSGGMKRRLNLAAALLHDPSILLLDEPTVGVDPQSRNAIFDNLEHLKSEGKAIVYTTHYMEEVERLCDRVVIIDHGKVIANDTCENLYRTLPGSNILQVQLDCGEPVEGLAGLAGVDWVDQQGTALRVGLKDLNATTSVLGALNQRGVRYSHLTSERASLESVFLTLTGRRLRDA